jgi:hypothetical protein
VLAGVRLEVMVPSAEAPSDGRLVVSVEMPGLATPDWRPGKAFGVTSIIQQRLADVLLGCGVLPLSDLCIAREFACRGVLGGRGTGSCTRSADSSPVCHFGACHQLRTSCCCPCRLCTRQLARLCGCCT